MSFNIPVNNLPRIVIIGGGFAGINLARHMRKLPVQIVLIDRQNYHGFWPLLYQVATGGLEPDSIAFPLRKLFDKQKNLFFRQAEVLHVDPEFNRVETNIGSLEYDHLVIATGTQTNFYGNESIERMSMPMKTIPEALNLRSMVLQSLEAANREEDPTLQDALTNFVVVGGGPTGVELAGALAELKNHIVPKDYPEIYVETMSIHLLEGSDRLLQGMSDKSGKEAKEALEKMGVHVHLNSFVKDYDGKIATTSDPNFTLEAETLIWAAGIRGNVIDGISDSAVGRGGRYKVDAYNNIEGYENIYAIGDLALMTTDAAFPEGHPQVAQVAMQQGEKLASNFDRLLKGQTPTPFSYFDKGTMATIGRNKAVLDSGKLHLKGFVAWMGWMFVHILYLIGFRNRLVVFVNWVWNYVTYDQGNRLIIRHYEKPNSIQDLYDLRESITQVPGEEVQP